MNIIYIVLIVFLSINIFEKQKKLKNIEKGLNDLFQKRYIDFKSFKTIDILIQYIKSNFKYYRFNDIERLVNNNQFINKYKEPHKEGNTYKDDKVDENSKKPECINTKDNIDINIDDNNNIKKEENYMIKDTKMKDKREIDISKILLILGTIFVLTSSIIFATTNWQIMSENVKMITLFISGALQLLVSFLYFKKFEIKKISLTFYILGTTILSFVILSIGYFKIDYNGNLKGWYLILTLFFASLVFFQFLGLKIYKNIVFQWGYLFFINLVFFFLFKTIINNNNIAILGLSIYSLILMIYTRKIDTNKEEDKFLNKKRINFIRCSKINIIFIIMGFIILSNSNIISIITAIILALSIFSLNLHNLDDFYIISVFTFLLMSTLVKIGQNSDISLVLYLSTAPLILSILNMLNLFSKKHLKIISIIIMKINICIFIGTNVHNFILSPSIYNIISIIILIVSFNLSISKVYNKINFYINPFLLFLLIVQLDRYLQFIFHYNNIYLVLLNSLITFLVYIIHILFKKNDKYILRNYVSVSIFPIYLLLLGTFYCISIDFNYSLVCLSFTLGIFLINSLLKYKKYLINYIFSSLFSLTSVIFILNLYIKFEIWFLIYLIFALMIIIIFEIFNNNKKMYSILKTTINITYYALAEIYIALQYANYLLFDVQIKRYEIIILSFLVTLLILIILHRKSKNIINKTKYYIYTSAFIFSIFMGSFTPLIVFDGLYIYIVPILICLIFYLLINLMPSPLKSTLNIKYLLSMKYFMLIYNLIYILVYLSNGLNFNLTIVITILFIITFLLGYNKLSENIKYIFATFTCINTMLIGLYLDDFIAKVENVFIIYFGLILLFNIILICIKGFYIKLYKFINIFNIIFLIITLYFVQDITSYMYCLFNMLPIYYCIQLIKQYKLGKINNRASLFIFVLFVVSYILSPIFIHYGEVADINILILLVLYSIILYVVFIFIDRKDNKIKFNKYIFIKTNILLCIWSSILVFNIINNFIDGLFLILSLIVIVLSCIKIKNNIITIIPILSIHLYIINKIEDFVYANEIEKFYILFLLGYVMVLLCSRFINKNLIIKNSYLKKIYIDYVPFALVTIFFIKYINLYNFEAFLILGVSLLGFYNRNLGKKFDKIISILSVTSIFIALLFIQEYNIIPTGVKLEFNFICIYIYLCALRYLLKLKFKNTVFYTYWIIALTILFLDTFIGGMIYDIIFLGMICCLILFYGIKNKNKKYMALSLLFLLIVTINNTFIFWKEFVWFIYLIIIGLIFIFVALFFESRKRKSGKDRKIKEDDEINFNDSINLSKQDILNKNNKNNYKKIETKYKKYKSKRRIIKNKIKRKQKTKRYR